MTWAKVDDQFHAHRKAKKAWKGHPRALGLHLFALSYCAGHLTDGLVDDEFVEEKLPVVKERTAVTDALMDAGLWTRETEGWRINDWLDYNPSRTEVLDRRRKDSERKQRKDSKRSPSGIHAEAERRPNGLAGAAAQPPPDPTYPNQTPPNPPEGGRERDHLEYGLKFNAWVAEHFPGVQPGLVKHCVSKLEGRKIAPTADALRPLVENGGVVPFKQEAA